MINITKGHLDIIKNKIDQGSTYLLWTPLKIGFFIINGPAYPSCMCGRNVAGNYPLQPVNLVGILFELGIPVVIHFQLFQVIL
jgi:hypothetical protein